jgi:hypothetical protein
MGVLRFFLLLFNVAVIGYLVFEIINTIRTPMDNTKKTVIIVGGIILLLAPLGIFLRFFAPTIQYIFIYPLAIALFLYLTRRM